MAAVLGAALVLSVLSLDAISPEIIDSVEAVPPEIAGPFREPAGFQAAASGEYFVFDRRGHTVYGVDAAMTSSWRIVDIGAEPGRILAPSAFSVAPDGTFVVADAPGNRERIQIFTPGGVRTGGFLVRERTRPRIVLNGLTVGGIGSLQYTGSAILMSEPDTGALISEYTLAGGISRLIGSLRHTGHEDDPDLHLALNAGLPLVDPTGGYFYVFQTGEPVIRKYDAAGTLQFERRIQGREIEELLGTLPTTWAERRASEGELPLVMPTIRTAAVDGAGRLWVGFVVPYTYVFDADGDKIRTLQLRGTGLMSPDSMFFDRNGRLLTTPGLLAFQP
jgi:hypothetical protein